MVTNGRINAMNGNLSVTNGKWLY